MLVDDRINFAFAETDFSKFKRPLFNQRCMLASMQPEVMK